MRTAVVVLVVLLLTPYAAADQGGVTPTPTYHAPITINLPACR